MSGSITITSVLRRTAQAYRAQAVLILSASLAVVVVVGGIESLPIGNPYARLATALVSLMAVALFVGIVVQIVAGTRERQSKAELRQAIRTATSATGEMALVLIVASILIVLLLLAASFLLLSFRDRSDSGHIYIPPPHRPGCRLRARSDPLLPSMHLSGRKLVPGRTRRAPGATRWPARPRTQPCPGSQKPLAGTSRTPLARDTGRWQ
jgi:hypothetical protein